VAALIAAARELWEYLAGTAAGFAPAISVVVAPRSSLCPPGWAGIVVIGDAVLATAPDHGTALLVEQALSGPPAAWLEPTDMPWGNRSVILRDPDGGLVNLFSPITPEAKAKYGL
jgi:hypothetical protein